MTKKQDIPSAVVWYQGNKQKYDDLVANLRELIRSLLVSEGIAFVDVQGRSKSHESFAAKISKKPYENPVEQVTDLAGLRVITLVESDIARVSEVVSNAFRVFPESSIDKSDVLGADRVGYRSLHLICDLGEARARLPEFKRFAACKFEIQIRTSLQHAWAEIEHDRGYKLRGTLPSHLKRKFSLLAGLLELADTQFDELSKSIDQYVDEVARKAQEGDLRIELNSSSIRELCILKFGEPLQDPGNPRLWAEVIQELRDFGVDDLGALDGLISSEVRDLIVESSSDRSLIGMVRDVMMLNDIEKYFAKSWHEHWGGISADSYRALQAKYGLEPVQTLFDRLKIYYELSD